MTDIANEHLWCPIDLVIHIVGSRWTVPVIMELHKGARRPSEILKTLNGISPKTLTQRLRELEKWGLVTRQAYQEIPPRVDYALSDRGTDLIYVIEALRDLGESWQRGMDMKLAPHIKEQCSHCFEYRSATEGTTSVDNQ